jgi:hypothetical protein
VRTGTSEETILNCKRSLSDTSLLSTSSNEDKDEDASKRACQCFIGRILHLFQSIRFLSPNGKLGDKLVMYANL